MANYCEGYPDGSYDGSPQGEFRDLTDEEWDLLKKGENPWNESEWRDESVSQSE